MSSVSSFSLYVEVRCECGGSCDTCEVGCCNWKPALDEACSKDASTNDIFVVSSVSLKLSPEQHLSSSESDEEASLIAIFIPKEFLDEKISQKCKSIEWIGSARSKKFANDIVTRIHPCLADAVVRGAIRQAAADVLLVEARSTQCMADMVDRMNGEGMVGRSDAIIKALPLSEIVFTINEVASLSSRRIEIPSCPVCLHRIDPVRIGLPKPKNHQLCSKFCGCTFQLGGQITECSKQRFLSPWPPPTHCNACNVINDHWKNAARIVGDRVTCEAQADSGEAAVQDALATPDSQTELFCNRCGMQETLWVCLLCGFVGCGRYSNVHAEEHYKESGHNYSLELVTLRIWDYANGEFAHRGDLLECPSVRRTKGLVGLGKAGAPSAFRRMGSRDSDGDEDEQHGGFESQNFQMPNFYALSGDETSPKKANMVGQEYEALLQSALEDQAQHYEGEITRLRATLTAEQVDESAVTEEEMKEIEALRADISYYRAEIDGLGRQLLDSQAQEAGYRASSQRLLREQAIATEVLDKIREEAARENEEGKRQVDELEQQISDLTANLRMRDQFVGNEELSNAQIFGTTSNKKQAKRGKKTRRFWK